jgi:hypothetical protein
VFVPSCVSPTKRTLWTVKFVGELDSSYDYLLRTLRDHKVFHSIYFTPRHDTLVANHTQIVLCEPAKFNDIEKEYKPDIMVSDGVAGIWEPRLAGYLQALKHVEFAIFSDCIPCESGDTKKKSKPLLYSRVNGSSEFAGLLP